MWTTDRANRKPGLGIKALFRCFVRAEGLAATARQCVRYSAMQGQRGCRLRSRVFQTTAGIAHYFDMKDIGMISRHGSRLAARNPKPVEAYQTEPARAEVVCNLCRTAPRFVEEPLRWTGFRTPRHSGPRLLHSAIRQPRRANRSR